MYIYLQTVISKYFRGCLQLVEALFKFGAETPIVLLYKCPALDEGSPFKPGIVPGAVYIDFLLYEKLFLGGKFMLPYMCFKCGLEGCSPRDFLSA